MADILSQNIDINIDPPLLGSGELPCIKATVSILRLWNLYILAYCSLLVLIKNHNNANGNKLNSFVQRTQFDFRLFSRDRVEQWR